MQRGWKAVAMAAVLGGAGAASAHEFTCEKRIQVQGEKPTDEAPRVTRFPATLRVKYKLKNIHPSGESVANEMEDALMAPYGLRFPFSTSRLALGVGKEREATYEVKLASPEACQALAATDGTEDGHFDSAFRVKWDLGETQCAARVSCCEPFVDCEMACPPHDPQCTDVGNPVAPATSRNAGFFKVHEGALQQCLALGRMDLGVARVESLEQALGLLWASPGLDRNGEARSDSEAGRFELAREALVASCNERLFGTEAKRSRALDEALRTLRSSGNGSTGSLATELRRANEAGTREPLPQGFDAGRATPAHAASIAVDPTEPVRR